MPAPRRPRLLASLTASTALLYLAALSPASALGSHADNPPNILINDILLDGRDGGRSRGPGALYESEFTVLGGGSLKGRASNGINVLGNNAPERLTLERGSTAYFALSLDRMTRRAESATAPDQARRQHVTQENDDTSLARDNVSGDGLLRRREVSPSVFVSANICRYPERIDGASSDSPPPQLRLLVSPDGADEHPDSANPTTNTEIFHEGAAMKRISAPASTIYFSIEAPELPYDDFAGAWDLEVAVSIDDWYHRFEDDEDSRMLRTVGLDHGSALFTTETLTDDDRETQAILDSEPPYALFVYNANSAQLKNVRRSHCGLETYAQIASTNDKGSSSRIATSVTTRGVDKLPRQQFRVEGLDAKTAYTAILVHTGRDTLIKRQNGGADSGGVQTFPATDFKTATGDNCKVITDLDFCSDVEYSVPANEERFNTTALAKKYDDYAKAMYENFEKVLQQIPCEAPVISKYSLARSCDDCKVAYKNWLCTVAMPRCEDFFDSDNPHVLERNLGQDFPNGTSLDKALVDRLRREKGPAVMASRNAWIDEEIAPGPYKEVLPCDDVCNQLVQSCSAQMQFNCPLPDGDDRMFSKSYARRVDERSCNALGSPIKSDSARLAVSGAFFVALMLSGMALL